MLHKDVKILSKKNKSLTYAQNKDTIKIKVFIHWFDVNSGNTLSLYSKSTMEIVMGRLRLHIQHKKMMKMPKNHRVLFNGNGDFVVCDLIRKEDVNGDKPEKVLILAHDIPKAKQDPFHTGYNIMYTYRHRSDKFPVFDENHNDVILKEDDMIVFDLTENLA